MSETKDDDSMTHMDEPMTVADTPPPYSSGPQPTTAAPVMHAPVMHSTVMHASVMHAPICVVGTNVGMVGMGPHATVVPVMMMQQMSPRPVMMTCKSCNMDITTRVDSKPTWKTHFFAGVLCLMGCWCCVCVPYFTKSCLDGEHYCPNCNTHIGSYTTYS